MSAEVSVAFRRSPRSPRGGRGGVSDLHGCVSIAFRRPPRSPLEQRMNGYCVKCKGLHCLSAFSAFTTRSRGSLLQPSHRVSIGFRRSLRSPRTYLFWHKLNKVVESPLPFGVHRVHHSRLAAGCSLTLRGVSIVFR